MNDFINNHCTLCKKVFCCVKCREKHQIQVHKINIECDICLYGQITLYNPSETLLEHIKLTHWPLHCIICKYVFESIEIILNNKCVLCCQHQSRENLSSLSQDVKFGNWLIPPTPSKLLNLADSNFDYESPPLNNLNEKGIVQNQFLRATSTPMYRTESVFIKLLENEITHDSSSKSQISNIKKNNSTQNEQSLKRRVTFCETPMIENVKKEESNMDHDAMRTNISSESNEKFYSAKERLDNEETPIKNLEIELPVALESIKVEPAEFNENPQEETTWETAIILEQSNSTPNDDKKIFLVTPIIDKFTPISANLKKRKPVQLCNNLDLDSGSTPSPVAMIKEETMHSANNIFASTKVEISCEYSQNSTADIQNIENEVIASTSKVLEFWPVKSECPEISTIQKEQIQKENKSGIWISMSKIVKSVIGFSAENISDSGIPNSSNGSNKRILTENVENDDRPLKKYKLTEIKCRRPIRDLGIYSRSLPSLKSESNTYEESETKEEHEKDNVKKLMVDKWTQTD